jgi:hypothetical protein
MIESIMYFGIGFLVAILIALAIIPLVHNRAVRLTIRRLQDTIPQSMAEVQANTDALRAEFAMSTRRLEITVDKLKTEHANQLAELGKKSDAVNRLQIERETQNVKAAALEAEVVALNERLAAADKEIKAASRSHTDDLVPLAPETDLAGEEGPSVGFVGAAGGAHDADPRFPGHRNDQFTGMQFRRNLARLSAAALIIVGVPFVWQQYHTERGKDVLKRISSLGGLLFMPVTKSPPADVATEQTDSNFTAVPVHNAEPQPAPLAQPPSAPSAAAISPNVSELAGKQEQSSEQIQAVEPNSKQEKSSSPLPNGPIAPERKAASLEGWTLRKVINGIAVLAGPSGIWRATPGDTLPGVGKVESYIRSNGQWIVTTSNGLISMPVRQDTSSSPLQSRTASTPETSAKTIEDWTLREVANGTAVLHGPVGISRVTIGDTLAGLGKVTAIVRWGKGWVVATTVGYCTNAGPDHADEHCKRYSSVR